MDARLPRNCFLIEFILRTKGRGETFPPDLGVTISKMLKVNVEIVDKLLLASELYVTFTAMESRRFPWRRR